jgi:signal transduction histidine kinase
VLDWQSDHRLAEALELIVAEFRTIAPDQQIDVSIDIPIAVHCDRARIAQLLSNLLGNAITHGAADRPIHVAASVTGGVFRLKVANEGRPIPADRIPELFTAFSKLGNELHREGLALGLYIASEIAKAHGGVVTARSDAEKTVFTFEMPCQ